MVTLSRDGVADDEIDVAVYVALVAGERAGETDPEDFEVAVGGESAVDDGFYVVDGAGVGLVLCVWVFRR